jgi:hypothetical protein
VTFLVVLITIPLAVLMNGIIRQNRENQAIEHLLQQSPILEDAIVLDIDRSQNRDQLIISATIKTSEPITQEQVTELARVLESELDRPLVLDIISLPVIRSE